MNNKQKCSFLLIVFIFAVLSPLSAQETTPQPSDSIPITSDNVSELVELFRLEGHTDTANSVAFSPTENLLVSGADDDDVIIWDLGTGELVKVLPGHTDNVESVAFSPDGTLIASGGSDDTVRLWDVETLTELATLEGHTNQVRAVAFSPDGEMLASASTDGTIRLWNIETLQTIAIFEPFLSLYALAYSPLGDELATGVRNTAQLWNIEDATISETLESDTSEDVRSVEFSPNGSLLAAGSHLGNLVLWDLENGEQVFSFVVTYSVDAITFSPDGALLVIGDGLQVQILDVETGVSLLTLRVAEDSVRGVDFSSLGDMIAATTYDIIQVWSVPATP